MLQNPLTTENVSSAAPELLRNEVDQRLTKLRPMATPVDQLSRYAASRPCKSMIVDYYAVATRPELARLKQSATLKADEILTVNIDNPHAFDVSETAMLPAVLNENDEAVIVYVVGVTDASVRLKAVNLSESEEIPLGIGSKLVRMGRAAGELDVQTSQYATLPTKQQNYCQIFKAQVEQSTLLSSANKEVGWSFSDQEEVAIYDMRLGMERSFLFGNRARIVDPVKKSEVFLTGGIWNQAGKDASYTKDGLTNAEWLKVMSTAFTGHAGSARKILIAGTGLIEQLSMLDGNSRVMLPGDVVTRWGLDFTEMHSKFGTLYVIHSEVLDSCGHKADGLIIDPEFLTKYVRVPFSATTLDLRTSGQRNTQAVVMTEVSCLVLRYPEAHVRVVAE